MNRGELRTLVLQNTKRTDKLDLINSALDMAVDEVSAAYLWSDLLTEDEVILYQGQPVSLATNTARVVEVRLVDGTVNSQPLQIRPKSWLAKYFPVPDLQAQRRPVYGYFEGVILHTIPLPAIDYTIRYSYYPLHGAFTGDASELLIRHASKAVVAYATHWMWFSLERYQDAEAWMTMYQRALESAKKLDKDNSAVQYKGDIRGAIPQTVYNPDDPFLMRVP
jgi:hypothetical protein